MTGSARRGGISIGEQVGQVAREAWVAQYSVGRQDGTSLRETGVVLLVVVQGMGSK